VISSGCGNSGGIGRRVSSGWRGVVAGGRSGRVGGRARRVAGGSRSLVGQQERRNSPQGKQDVGKWRYSHNLLIRLAILRAGSASTDRTSVAGVADGSTAVRSSVAVVSLGSKGSGANSGLADGVQVAAVGTSGCLRVTAGGRASPLASTLWKTLPGLSDKVVWWSGEVLRELSRDEDSRNKEEEDGSGSHVGVVGTTQVSS